jgi:hypothetical protein
METPPPPHLVRRPWFLSVLLAVAFIPFKLHGFRLSYLNIHAARDWERGWQLLSGERFWAHGPELLFGGSIPGFFFYVLTGLSQFPYRLPEVAAAMPAMMFCASIGFFHDTLRRLYSTPAALLGTLAYGCFPFGTLALRYLWNPSYLFLFGTLALWLLVRSFTEQRRALAGWALLPILLAGQIHLTAYFVAAALVGVLVARRWFPGWRPLAVVVLVVGVFLAPYYIQQVTGGWSDHVGLRANTQRTDGVSILRLRPNPNFLHAAGLQVLVQAPSERLWPQTFPFSYYDRLYLASPAARVVGWVAFGLGCCLLPLIVVGAVRPGEGTARRTACLYAAVALVAVGLPQMVWNPRLGSDAHSGVAARYFFAAWPCQFLLLAAGIDWALRRPAVRPVVTALVGATCAAGLVLATLFTLEAGRSGHPFRYLTYDNWPVHTLRDKMAIARYLVREYGVDEDIFRARMHTQDGLLSFPEESLDYEIRAAAQTIRPRRPADPGLYYFLFDPAEQHRLRGEFEVIELRTFGPLALLVYRPMHDLTGWRNDPPVSWWW